jgi:ribosomal protein L11 methylase PrmA
MSLWVSFIFLIILSVLALVLVLYASMVFMLLFGAPWVPTGQKVAEAMLNLADVQKGETVLDLGSGHGAIPLLAAKRGARGIGCELHPVLVIWSRFRAIRAGLSSKTSFMRANVVQTNLPEADVITLYLLDPLVQKLRPKLAKYPSNVRIVSHGFPFAGVKAVKTMRQGSSTLYLYSAGDLA